MAVVSDVVVDVGFALLGKPVFIDKSLEISNTSAMISSMTGFGSAHAETDKISLTVLVKSVNGRFLETRFRTPREYFSLESEFKRQIAAKIQRGTVDLSIHRRIKDQTAAIEVSTNVALAKSWLLAANTLAEQLKVPGQLSLESLLRVPDVIQLSDQGEIPDWEREAVLTTLDQALQNCLKEKKREGEEQFKTFSHLLDGLDTFVNRVEKQKKQIDDDLQSKLRDRLKQISDQVTVDPNRLAQEVLFLTDKADIAEEIARAQAHLKAYRRALKETASVGKKLEFYTQELHREVNTMGSKTQALDVTLDIIEAKTNVERLREQVQNVE